MGQPLQQFCRTFGLLILTIFVAIFVDQKAQADFFETLLMPGELIEGHAEYEENCQNCHITLKRGLQRKLCLDCHDDIATDITETRGFHGHLTNATAVSCHTCHTDHKGRDADIIQFNPSTFDHNQTDFPLKGMHKGADCNSCHQPSEKFRDAPLLCVDCHQQQDSHRGNMGNECQDCHSEEGWKKAIFDHEQTEFSLTGAHQSASCDSCHPAQQFEQTSPLCVSCHLVNDIHGGNHGNECERCHQDDRWDQVNFNHNEHTDYTLVGAHKELACSRCHVEPVFTRKPSKHCSQCHKNEDLHHGRFGNQCNDCHGQTRWSTNSFDHDADTDFPLSGKHKQSHCDNCHRGQLDETLDTACISCHQGEDVHHGGQGKDCAQCHSTESFTDKVRFDHDLSRFPLIGQHALASCDDCHLNKTYIDTSLECVNCHLPSDIHDSALGEQCHQCHNPNDWALWYFDHQRQTDFSLDGKHSGLACMACHQGSYQETAETSGDCVSCHLADDIHYGDFGNQCDQCHTSESFNDLQKMER